jgi:choline dehydrogenase-like flavoprotein
MSTQHYDVIIIGTGAGGGTLVHRLAPSGKRILLLERGGYLPREPENWDSREVFLKDRYLSDEVWYDKDGEAFKPHQQYFVGGNTKFYGAILFRLRERDFGEIQHHGGVSPSWPISYRDLEPYYSEAEKLYLVHGQAGEDPTEPPRSGPFPYPAVSHEPRIQHLADDFEKAGHRPFHLPVGVDLNESDAEAGRCVRCDRFDGFPCLTDGKADAHVRCVRPALKHENVTLVTHATAERLLTDGSGHSVTGVVVDHRGVRETYSGDIVVVSCGAVNSAALLLKSANDTHPAGLANASDVVGRHYMAHINSGVIAISQAPNPTKFQKTLGINDYYWGADDAGLPLGHIQMLGKSDRNILRGGRSLVRSRARTRLRRAARHRLLDHHRGPASPGQPGDGGPAGPYPPGQDLPQPGTPQALAGQAEGPHGPARLPRHRHPELVNTRQAHSARGSRPPKRHGAIRR